jgi:heme/copper-type cytochrome/quinol oxidase subunit 2
MKNKLGVLVSLGALVILVGAGCSTAQTPTVEDTTQVPQTSENNSETATQPAETVKEFTMTAYYDPALKKPIFSLPEMSVKKGEKVRVKITNTMGVHDFVINEFNVAKELPLNQEVVVEFTADKAGEFTYYCSKPGHREAGQLGTLKVAE